MGEEAGDEDKKKSRRRNNCTTGFLSQRFLLTLRFTCFGVSQGSSVGLLQYIPASMHPFTCTHTFQNEALLNGEGPLRQGPQEGMRMINCTQTWDPKRGQGIKAGLPNCPKILHLDMCPGRWVQGIHCSQAPGKKKMQHECKVWEDRNFLVSSKKFACNG